MFCYSNIVDKELKYNQYIFIYSIDSHASHPKEQCCSEKTDIQSLEILWRQSWWRHCKVSSVQVQPNSRWPHKSSLQWWKHHKSQFPLLAKLVKVVFPVQAASSKSERVTPKKAKLNPEKEEDLAVVKCNMRLLKAWASETKLLPYWLIDCLDVDLNKSKCIINQLSNLSDFSWIHFFYRDILIYYKRISCQDN